MKCNEIVAAGRILRPPPLAHRRYRSAGLRPAARRSARVRWNILSVLAGCVLLAGCRGTPAPGERHARRDLETVTSQLQPGNARPSAPERGSATRSTPLRRSTLEHSLFVAPPWSARRDTDPRSGALPELTANSSLSNFLAFALLNSPSIQAAFYDWSASVEDITVARSLPDPQLTFQAYIENSLTSLMPGFAWNLPGPGKRAARAGVAAAVSEEKYFAFESAVFQAAFDLKKTYYTVGLLAEQLRLKRAALALLGPLDQALRAQNETGQGSLANIIRAEGERERLRTDLENLDDSERSARENFKAALGLTPGQPDPPTPAHFEFASENPDFDELLRIGLAHNPQLRAMAAEVRAADREIAVAYKERVPDFNAGLSAEVYTPPFFWPQAGMTLPIWRDKLAAEIAGAEAAELAARARWRAAQINVAVSFAEKSFACRETSRNLALLEDKLIPQADQLLETIRASYQVGQTDFARLTDAERGRLDLQLAAAQARTDHAMALAELSLIVAGVPPPGAPVLPQTP